MPREYTHHHLFGGGGGNSKLVLTSHDSTGVPCPAPVLFFFTPGALIHGTAGGGTTPLEIASPMSAGGCGEVATRVFRCHPLAETGLLNADNPTGCGLWLVWVKCTPWSAGT